jgi:hypothetical protein
MRSVVGLTLRPRDFGLSYVDTKTTLLASGRVTLVKQALELSPDWLLLVDADMVFPADGLERLLAHDLDVVGCNYVQRMKNGTTAGRDGREVMPAHGVERVNSLGLGFCLVRASVFDRIAKPWFHTQWLDEETMMGEDVYFCHRLAQAGIAVHVDHDLSAEVGHIRTGPAFLKDEPLHRAA